MKKKIKLITLIICVLVIILIFLFVVFKSRNYKSNYNVDKFDIMEKYYKDTSYYTFLLTKDDIIYPYMINSKYLKKRNLISKVKVYENDNNICVIPISKKIDFYPLCSDGNNVFTYNLSEVETNYKYNEVKDLSKEYNDIKINYLNNQVYALYNYKGFNIISDKNNKVVNIFNKDVYTIDLIYQIDNMLLIVDYNKDHYFNTFYLLNMANGKLKEIVSESDISFDSVFLGDYKNKIYLLDKKEKVEYEINLKKGKINKIEFKILENNKFVEKTFKEIVNKDLNFLKQNIIEYKLVDDKLYKKIEGIDILISNNEVSKIVKNDNDTVYYLVKEKLYMYNDKYGEVLLLSNFEWNFNNTNMIYMS